MTAHALGRMGGMVIQARRDGCSGNCSKESTDCGLRAPDDASSGTRLLALAPAGVVWNRKTVREDPAAESLLRSQGLP